MRRLYKIMQNCFDIAVVANGRCRAIILRLRGAKIARKVSIGSGCRVDRPWCLRVGSRSLTENDVYIKIVKDDAVINIGEHVFIGRGTEFDIIEKLVVGEHTIIAPNCFITDHKHGMEPGLRIDQQPCRAKPVVLGSDVWIGTGVVILPGVAIGEGAVVGAGAVVTKDVPPFGVVAGVPARLMRLRDGKA